MQEKTFKIGEAAEILGLKSYVLRYWETEFSQLIPLRTEKGQRLYTDKHISLLGKIKDLLHIKGMTIEGTRKILASGDNIEGVEKAIFDVNVIADPSNNVTLIEQNQPNMSTNTHNKANTAELIAIASELTSIKELLEGS